MHSVPRNPTLVALMGFSVVPPLALVLELCTGDALYNVLHSKGWLEHAQCVVDSHTQQTLFL